MLWLSLWSPDALSSLLVKHDAVVKLRRVFAFGIRVLVDFLSVDSLKKLTLSLTLSAKITSPEQNEATLVGIENLYSDQECLTFDQGLI